jgi:hypothetical protein
VEAVGKWNARPDNAKALPNDDATTEYDFTDSSGVTETTTNANLL